MRKCICLVMSAAGWCLLSVVASAQVLQVPQQTVSPGGVGMGGQPLPGFIQNPGQFPQGFVPGGQGMGAQMLPPGMTPNMPVGQIMQLRALQMMGAAGRGRVQYGPGGYNNGANGLNNAYNNNPNFGTPTVPVDPEQVKRDERRSKVKERADLKRAKEKDLAEQRKAKAQDAKNNAAQAKVADEKE